MNLSFTYSLVQIKRGTLHCQQHTELLIDIKGSAKSKIKSTYPHFSNC